MPAETKDQFSGTVSETATLAGITRTVICGTDKCDLFKAGAVSDGTVIPARPETFLDQLGQPTSINNCASASAPVINAGRHTCSGIKLP
jgi:hypothetical protein